MYTWHLRHFRIDVFCNPRCKVWSNSQVTDISDVTFDNTGNKELFISIVLNVCILKVSKCDATQRHLLQTVWIKIRLQKTCCLTLDLYYLQRRYFTPQNTFKYQNWNFCRLFESFTLLIYVVKH